MMDGRIGEIRNELDKNGYEKIQILSYAIKYSFMDLLEMPLVQKIY